MLIPCPECSGQASDKAFTCPHCGYPLRDPPREYQRKSRRKRLPNGFGQITEIKNQNLTKPFRAMVTVGYREDGRPLVRNLQPAAYFPTYNDAYTALLKYNDSPYDLSERVTLASLYDRWLPGKISSLTSSRARQLTGAWKHCEQISSMQVCAIRSRHIRACIDACPSQSVKLNIKQLLNMLLDYAVEYELTDRNYARQLPADRQISQTLEDSRTPHIPYTDAEISALWNAVDTVPYADMILVQCYSGWRPQELCTLETANINLTERTMIGGMKTKAGKNRTVPIHPAIHSLILARYNLSHKYLFSDDTPLTPTALRRRYDTVISALHLNPDHRPHDGRKHFITQAKKYNLDEYAIKYIVGHAIRDVTERVYTQREFSWLLSEIQKIPSPVGSL